MADDDDTEREEAGERPATSGDAHPKGSGYWDTTARTNPPSSPVLYVVAGSVLLPAEFAIAEGAEFMAVAGLVLIQVSALLVAPKALWSEARSFERRWADSKLAQRQMQIGAATRAVVGALARASVFVSISAVPIFAAGLISGITVVQWIGTVLAIWALFLSLPLLIASGLLSGYLLPQFLRKVPRVPFTLSDVLDRLYEPANEARTFLIALVLFLIGTAAAVAALAPGNAPFP